MKSFKGTLSVINVFTLFLATLLVGCERVGDPLDPDIGNIQTRINHNHPSMVGEEPTSEDPTILSFDVEFKIYDPEGVDNVAYVVVRDTNNATRYTATDRVTPSQEIGSYFDIYRDVFSMTSMRPGYYDDAEVHPTSKIDLSNWQIYVEDFHGYKESKDFAFLLPDGEEAGVNDYVYAPHYDDIDINGTPAMEVMTIADNNLSFSKDDDSEYFTVNFTTSELRAINYQLYFFNNSKSLIGAVPFDASPISNSSINHGAETSVTLHWSDMVGVEEASQADSIVGVHIVLFDEAFESELVAGETWFHFSGGSEYVLEGSE